MWQKCSQFMFDKLNQACSRAGSRNGLPETRETFQRFRADISEMIRAQSVA